MMYSPTKNLTLVLYEDQHPTRCFEFKKNRARLLLIFVSLLFLLLLVSGMFIFSYIRNVTFALEEQRPLMVKEFQKEKQEVIGNLQELEKSKRELEAQNILLLNKLKAAKGVEIVFPLIHPPLGSKDLTDKQLLSIDSFKLKERPGTAGRLSFAFNLISNKESKVSGHIFILLKSGASVSMYPPQGIASRHNFVTTFDSGEPFSVSHLRPVNASFNLSPAIEKGEKLNNLWVEILIFGREGDLLLKKTINGASLL
ncbi:MAG: hypothetical protein HQK53_03335 [Oligoflexia bacterium]|nr:hypothetical protein [Oligoflexia bacterium]